MNDRRSTSLKLEKPDLLIENEEQRALQEAKNGLLQFDEVLRLIDESAASREIKITPELIGRLNYLAIQGIRISAGRFRDVPVSIRNTSHEPPPYQQVSGLVDEMCDYVNQNWMARNNELADAIHIAAYLMWRLNWIHPYRDGNGRTSRAISYLALSIRIGQLLPGTPTIADLIVENRQPYYEALDEADAAWRNGSVDVGLMEALIRRLLMTQLESSLPRK